MKTIKIFSSPGTEFEVERVVEPMAPNGLVYFLTDAGLVWSQTEQQSQARIKELEERTELLQKKLDDILDVINPDRHSDEDDY